MHLTYSLIPGGFWVVSDDGTVNLRQDFNPDLPGDDNGPVRYTPEEAEAAALAKIAALQGAQ